MRCWTTCLVVFLIYGAWAGPFASAATGWKPNPANRHIMAKLAVDEGQQLYLSEDNGRSSFRITWHDDMQAERFAWSKKGYLFVELVIAPTRYPLQPSSKHLWSEATSLGIYVPADHVIYWIGGPLGPKSQQSDDAAEAEWIAGDLLRYTDTEVRRDVVQRPRKVRVTPKLVSSARADYAPALMLFGKTLVQAASGDLPKSVLEQIAVPERKRIVGIFRRYGTELATYKPGVCQDNCLVLAPGEIPAGEYYTTIVEAYKVPILALDFDKKTRKYKVGFSGF